MTVVVPSRERSVEERRRLALEYVECRHGSKREFLEERKIAEWQMRRWVAALADGDLDGNVIPRQTGEMTREDAAEVRRLNARIANLETELDSERKVVDALGKAISVMHSLGVADDGEDPTGASSSDESTTS
ncbi:hypothetical protein [Dietzia kunjamensis]|uniref:hypothetical protein n=1 Tax=Dietzia kunjamensis TaxID=322509 RepID=UPI0012B9FDF2|nr:hypothetical protein [Dietzia kunjamensis]